MENGAVFSAGRTVEYRERVEGGGVRMGGEQEGVREQKEEDERERQRGSKEKEG